MISYVFRLTTNPLSRVSRSKKLRHLGTGAFVLSLITVIFKSFHSQSKKSKEENQKKETETSSRPPPGRVEDCSGVSVEFHVIIHEEWKFNPTKGEKSVHIRFGIDELGNWTWDCVDMEPAKLDECVR